MGHLHCSLILLHFTLSFHLLHLVPGCGRETLEGPSASWWQGLRLASPLVGLDMVRLDLLQVATEVVLQRAEERAVLVH